MNGASPSRDRAGAPPFTFTLHNPSFFKVLCGFSKLALSNRPTYHKAHTEAAIVRRKRLARRN
jgi:hypothetical protein